MNPDLSPIVQSLNHLVAALQKGWLDYVATFAVGLTFLVLIWYTYETYRLRKAAQKQTAETTKLLGEAQRQNEVSVMPMLAVISEKLSPTEKRQIVLVNIGSGPAFNVSIDRHKWENRELRIVIQNNILTPGQKYSLEFRY